MWSGRPVSTASRRAWISGGGGAVDHARHQRERCVQGSSQARTRRSVTGQVTMYVVLACDESAPIFPPAGRRAGRNGRVHARRNLGFSGWCQPTGGRDLLREPGLPAEPAERGVKETPRSPSEPCRTLWCHTAPRWMVCVRGYRPRPPNGGAVVGCFRVMTMSVEELAIGHLVRPTL